MCTVGCRRARRGARGLLAAAPPAGAGAGPQALRPCQRPHRRGLQRGLGRARGRAARAGGRHRRRAWLVARAHRAELGLHAGPPGGGAGLARVGRALSRLHGAGNSPDLGDPGGAALGGGPPCRVGGVPREGAAAPAGRTGVPGRARRGASGRLRGLRGAGRSPLSPVGRRGGLERAEPRLLLARARCGRLRRAGAGRHGRDPQRQPGDARARRCARAAAPRRRRAERAARHVRGFTGPRRHDRGRRRLELAPLPPAARRRTVPRRLRAGGCGTRHPARPAGRRRARRVDRRSRPRPVPVHGRGAARRGARFVRGDGRRRSLAPALPRRRRGRVPHRRRRARRLRLRRGNAFGLRRIRTAARVLRDRAAAARDRAVRAARGGARRQAADGTRRPSLRRSAALAGSATRGTRANPSCAPGGRRRARCAALFARPRTAPALRSIATWPP
jgi:hypothetical protein